ncbi:MAG: hypothetical protein JWN70_7016 [Planctomycetaceae bacterium]|nr:hypothetical protein [Planctomycetaceae bacterium]
MAKKPRKRARTRPHTHTHTDLVHVEIATQTPISPQREVAAELGRQRVLESRERVGRRGDREFLSDCFPPEQRM